MALEIIAILIVIIAVAAERVVEMVGSPLLEKYNIESSGVRTGVMVLLATAVNFALLYGFDLDPISVLLEENQSFVNIGVAAFMASGLSGISHSLQQFLGKEATIVEVLQESLDAAETLK
jgi:hypothetical protein